MDCSLNRLLKRSPQCISTRILCFALAAAWLAAASYGQTISPVITVDHGPNALQQLKKPYVILVSLDGFRYDYAKRYHADHLLAPLASAPRPHRSKSVFFWGGVAVFPFETLSPLKNDPLQPHP